MSEYLSNIELYFCSSYQELHCSFLITGEEFYHAAKVMRNQNGEKIYATDGNGKIFEGIIENITKDSIEARIQKTYLYKNELCNFTFCIPNLKNPDRLKFALEKCTELGITNFILFNSERSLSKNYNVERLNKILLSSMKQSLRSFMPKISVVKSIKEINFVECEVVLFEQLSTIKIEKSIFRKEQKYLMIFGPEGGLSEKEIEFINPGIKLNLAENRLRAETAIIMAASLLQ